MFIKVSHSCQRLLKGLTYKMLFFKCKTDCTELLVSAHFTWRLLCSFSYSFLISVKLGEKNKKKVKKQKTHIHTHVQPLTSYNRFRSYQQLINMLFPARHTHTLKLYKVFFLLEVKYKLNTTSVQIKVHPK